MRFLSGVILVLSCGLCLAEDLPNNPATFKSLTAEQATAFLAKFKGDFMDFDALTSIDKDVAKELAKFKGHGLFLNGLTSIDKDIAKELAKYTGGRAASLLNLDGLKSIDKGVAKELAKNKKRWLSLDGVTSINEGVARELANFEGQQLYLQGLTSITDKGVAQRTGEVRRVDRMDLHGLTSIDKDVLQILMSNSKDYSAFRLYRG